MDSLLFVGGVVPLTTLDYPGYISAVVFLQGCPWRCSYCHNQHLQTILPSESLPWEDVQALLRSRGNFIEAVVFSGGEPLVQPMLPSAINDIKKMKLRVGLHTAGAVPEMLARVATAVNWIGFDVKQLFEKYSSVTGVEGSGEAARESLKILVESQVDFEVRITVYETMDASDLGDLLKEISDFGVRNVALQKCRYLDESIIEHPIFCDGLFLEDMSKYFDGFFVR